MTLRRKMAYQIGTMILGLLLISAASLWGINALHQDFGSAIAGYQELREVYEMSSHISAARILLSLARPDMHQAMRAIQTADWRLKHPDSPAGISSADPQAMQLRSTLRAELVEAQSHWWAVMRREPGSDPSLLTTSLNRILKHSSDLAAQIRRNIQARQEAADRKRRTTLLVMGTLSAVVICGAVVVGVLQYGSVMRPLNRLGDGVRRVAQGHLSERVEPTGHAEFAALAADFNRMASELDELYHELEQKVAEKSKELVRSERLASVGYLAAGVAHEINNPIGIIAGYAELSLQQLRKSSNPAAAGEAAKAMEVISEEAFRCKQIVQQLLAMARPGEESRRRIALGDVAGNVVSMIAGLRDYHDRQLTLDIQRGETLDVVASEGEMKQVVLNLTLNAMDAVESGGQVRISMTRKNGMVEMCVEDNGRGMSQEVLDRVFEPFFTAKRGAGRPGTGLGLSITHAIIESHGGQITASSEGPGRGSRFIVRLPAAQGERA